MKSTTPSFTLIAIKKRSIRFPQVPAYTMIKEMVYKGLLLKDTSLKKYGINIAPKILIINGKYGNGRGNQCC